jgi:hypothetical protein
MAAVADDPTPGRMAIWTIPRSVFAIDFADHKKLRSERCCDTDGSKQPLQQLVESATPQDFTLKNCLFPPGGCGVWIIVTWRGASGAVAVVSESPELGEPAGNPAHKIVTGTHSNLYRRRVLG